MAHLLHATLESKGLQLDKTAFLYGNLAPDYIPSLAVTPHFTKVCQRRIDELTAELSETPLSAFSRINAEYSKKLGMLCHYLCDYFCFVHSKDFLGSLKQHSLYENALDNHLRHNWNRLLSSEAFAGVQDASDCAKLQNQLYSEKARYTAEGYSFDKDLCFAFCNCISTIVSLAAISRCLPLSLDMSPELQFSLRGYATGNCYVFRMFYFKNRNSVLFEMPKYSF